MKNVAFALLFVPLGVYGQQTTSSIPDEVFDQLAAELAELHEALLLGQQEMVEASTTEFQQAPNSVTVTAERAPVRAGASDEADEIALLTQGEQLRVIDKVGEWYAVEYAPMQSGWLSAEGVVPIGMLPLVGPMEGIAAAQRRIFRNLVERAASLRDSYSNNPYLSVSGFSIDLSVPPALTISFEFKDAGAEP
ncbi:MAG: SH3 domain-containing protein [Ectothiorhodospiraceae bacterium]|nr:SH3 domain-containing protein [Ectothiorhodospiraceae bacterium]MCH8503814.1 SH3 domain-containing protein [Ectothiorhodospiraceae bacterium]